MASTDGDIPSMFAAAVHSSFEFKKQEIQGSLCEEYEARKLVCNPETDGRIGAFALKSLWTEMEAEAQDSDPGGRSRLPMNVTSRRCEKRYYSHAERARQLR